MKQLRWILAVVSLWTVPVWAQATAEDAVSRVGVS
jgi:hypothetical protein